jgi:hypothetical protein
MNSSFLTIFKQICVYFSLIIAVCGTIGSVFTLLIYSSKKMRRNTISLYWCFMGILDILINLESLISLIQINYNLNLFPLFVDFVCQINQYVTYAVGTMSSWILVTISMDRFIYIAFSRRFPFLFKNKFRSFMIFLIVTCNLVFYLPMAWNSHVVRMNNVTNQTICLDYAFETAYWMNFFGSLIVPFCLLIFFTVALIVYIKKSRRRVNVAVVSSGNRFIVETSRDTKFVVTSLTLNLIFLILNLPLAVYEILNTLVHLSPEVNLFLINLTVTLWNVFYASDFYVQLAVNSIVRDQFLVLMKFKSQNDPSTQLQMT